MLVAALVTLSLVLIFFGSMVVATGFELLGRKSKGAQHKGVIVYIIGMGLLVAACASSFYAGCIA